MIASIPFIVFKYIWFTGTIESIRNEKLVVETIKSGKECGIVLKTSSDIITKPQEGDIIKTGIMTKAEKYLEWYPEGF